ncbi:hypothetical protein NA57DRAFT_77540 [Rhizodiscina lignyota]|uniref:LysM domain-containing protein n=1 Tax=Rhizodiscina lignyota TaxID=1504668 RepID=A0A9P4M416_9PEZI|nr:hypothetical protein NA57DRAFT_77540 [Rhizodiscina lignyota]
MSFIFALLAAGSLPTLISGAPLRASLFDKRAATTYTQYTGSGAPPSWPAQSTWQDFDTMFSENESIMKGSCSQWDVDNPSDQEISDMKSGIQTVASESGVPAQFILAVMMQESNGCPRAPTTNYGVRNPGLMQDHDGAATCNDGGSVQNPCPADTITQMLRDGVEGTSQGDGLKQCISEAGTDDVSKYYRAARIYNSGSVTDNNLAAGVATHCYASDIANRLVGWTSAPHDCNLDGADVPVNTSPPAESTAAPTSAAPPTSVASPTSVAPTSAASTPVYTPPAISTPAVQSPSTTAQPTTTVAPTSTPTSTKTKTRITTIHTFSAPAFSGFPSYSPQATDVPGVPSIGSPADNGAKAETPSTPSSSASVAAAAATTASPSPSTTSSASSSSSSSAPLGPGVSSSCPQLYTVADGDNCWTLGQQFGFTFAQFQSWNTQVDSQCSNLWKGYQYCVKGS